MNPSSNAIIGTLRRWLRALYALLIAPRSTDEDGRRQEYILNIILVASIGMLIILDGLVLYHSFIRQPNYTGVPFSIFTIVPLFFVVIYLLSRRGHPVTSAYLLIATLLFSNSYAALYWGIDLPVTLLAYAFIVCTAGILLGNAIGFLVTLCMSVIIGGIWSIHIHGFISPRHQYPSEDDIIVLCVFYFLIMTVSWLSNREIEKSLARARHSEHALKEERDMLEVRVTERTEEVRRMQFERVDQVHRFAEFGQLASGLFHDLLGLLNALSLRTEGTAEDEPSLVAAHATTHQIQQFMKAVQEQLGKENSREIFSLAEGVSQAIQLVNYKANKENVRIVFDLPPKEKLMYEGVPFKFHQIIINLLTNAIDAYRSVPIGGERSRTVKILARQNDDRFIITVQDNGSGIPAALQGRIFEPFFTTKSGTGEGTGIGLATIKKIIEEDFRGAITVTSSQNEATIFTVSFPIRCPLPLTIQSSTPSSLESIS